MPVTDTIFVGRADAIGLEVDGEVVFDLDGALREAASDATEISILGGYYAASWLVDLFAELPRHRRRDCKVRIAVGSDATTTLPRTWEQMRGVRASLRQLGFRDIQVAILGSSPVHFHTKLFRFLRTTRPSWFIGSANPGSERHELMVKVAGKHPGLSRYVEAVFKKAQPIDGQTPRRRRAADLRDFLLDGMLCHKPPGQQLFTFDAYRFSPEDRRRIDARLGEGGGVDYASPRTEGFGFELRIALGMRGSAIAKGGPPDTRILFRSSGMDTLFGLWMPRVYAEEAKQSVADQGDTNARRLANIGVQLAQNTDRVNEAFLAYLASMERYLAELGIDAKPVRDRNGAFERFLRSRTRGLNDPEFVTRHARVMTFAPMFDVWQDSDVGAEFERSFFEDLAWRAGPTALRQPKVVRSLLGGLHVDVTSRTAEDLQSAFVLRLAQTPWNDDEWEV